MTPEEKAAQIIDACDGSYETLKKLIAQALVKNRACIASMQMETNFDDVGDFHEKFSLPNFTNHGGVPHELDLSALQFRMNFMLEELREYAEANGFSLVNIGQGLEFVRVKAKHKVDLPLAADALIDLAYVVLGTAQLHHLPWQELWDEVQRANMAKERCEIGHAFEHDCHDHPGGPECDAEGSCTGPGEHGELCGQPRAKHGTRGSTLDVIKPPGWRPPDIMAVLERHGWRLNRERP